MSYPTKMTPVKFCLFCETKLERKRFPKGNQLEPMNIFLRRTHCDAKCQGAAVRARSTSKSAVYRHAQEFKGTQCEECGLIENLHIHHLDLNPTNNSSENLKTLCRSCHTKWHAKHGGGPWKRQLECKICGLPSKALYLCNKHYLRFKKHGSPFLIAKKGGHLSLVQD